ncbi:MAG: site-specific integrase [Bacteroides sp.]|nr:site-specific integrase [Bacteroides sp.]
MFLIGVVFQKSRSAKNPDKPGAIYIKITQNGKDKDGKALRINRLMKTDLTGTAEDYIDNNIEAIKLLVRLAYCIIEQLTTRDGNVSIDDVMTEFRKAVGGDNSYIETIKRARKDILFRSDLINVSDDLKRYFRFNYIANEPDDNSLFGYIESKAIQFKNEGKVALYRSYISLKNSVSRFIGTTKLKLNEIDRGFVEEYAKWLTNNGVSESTQSFYLRTLRSALNYASVAGLISIPDNMFEGLNTKVLIPSKRKNGSGIDNDIVKKIATIDLSDNPEIELARDMYMFAFFCHGMELVDVLNLKKSDVVGGTLVFQRRQKGVTVKVNLDKEAVTIINKYNSVTENYLFPPMEKYLRSQHFTVAEKIRSNIKIIGQHVGYTELTFSSNISAWKQLLFQLNISELLLKSV